MDVSQVIAFVGVVIYLGAFIFYNKQIIAGHSKPNTATWFLWVFLAGLNAVTYDASIADWKMTVQAYGAVVACTFTFLLALKKGRLSKLNTLNWTLLVLCLFSVGVWKITHDPMKANILLQVCIAISISPTWISVWQDPSTERPLPWFLFSVSYLFAIVVVLMNWEENPGHLAYPINCVVLHLVVMILAMKKKYLSTE